MPSLEKARRVLDGCETQKAVRRLEAVADVVASEHRGTELACDAKAIIGECAHRRAELDRLEKTKRDRGGRPKTGDLPGKRLPNAQLVAESKRAPLLNTTSRDRDTYYAACKKKLEEPTKGGLIALARQTPDERKATLATLADAPSVKAALGAAAKRVVRERLDSAPVRRRKALAGVYDVVVVDPPWPMEKVERDVRPNQSKSLDYPVMSEAEICAEKIPAADDCHLFLWTTSSFLPMAFRVLKAWGFDYACLFVWHKPGGFQPVGQAQYNCEPCLYARRGHPKFVDTKAFFTCFSASATGHSEKPEAFYDVLRRVTAGRRLDMFNRRSLEGFDGWGKESPDGCAAE